MKQNYINHIALVLDASSSMARVASEVIKVADNQIAYLAQRSKEMDQETRVTVYTFANMVQCVVYDKDVLRMPSLKGVYRASGNTALIDATLKAMDDLAKTPELYGDHAFLTYVLTDGEENHSGATAAKLSERLKKLPENWTLAAFVPDANGKFEAKKYGFHSDNIAVWDATTAKGMEEAGEVIRQTTDNFMRARSTGVRGYKNLFSMDDAVANVKTRDVAKLDDLHPGQYRIYAVEHGDDGDMISAFVERKTNRAYQTGEAFYQLTKPEKVQSRKLLALFDRGSKHVFTGLNARKVLGLPAYEVKVSPAGHPNYDIFVQSTSVNRKLVAGTKLLLIN